MSEAVRIQLPPDATSSAKPTNDAPPSSTTETTDERPAWLPEQFKTPEELAKSYSELRKKLSESKPSDEKPKEDKPADDKPAEDKPKEGDKPADEKPKENTDPSTDEVFTPFFKEFEEKGELSPESYEKLAKEHKLPKAVVDTYIEGVRLKQEAARSEIVGTVGGEENYTAMAEWARENLSPEEITAYNTALDSGDKATINLAVSGLYQKFSSSEGRPQHRIRGGGGNSNVTPFRNSAEVVKAMQDARYKTDPDYRKEVEDRLSVSSVF